MGGLDLLNVFELRMNLRLKQKRRVNPLYFALSMQLCLLRYLSEGVSRCKYVLKFKKSEFAPKKGGSAFSKYSETQKMEAVLGIFPRCLHF